MTKLVRPCCRYEDKITMDIREIGWGGGGDRTLDSYGSVLVKLDSCCVVR